MTGDRHCESCGMTIDDGTYCQHCTDEDGGLQTFEERLARMAQWLLHDQQATSHREAERKALAHMARMPAWRDHPVVRRVEG